MAVGLDVWPLKLRPAGLTRARQRYGYPMGPLIAGAVGCHPPLERPQREAFISERAGLRRLAPENFRKFSEGVPPLSRSDRRTRARSHSDATTATVRRSLRELHFVGVMLQEVVDGSHDSRCLRLDG